MQIRTFILPATDCSGAVDELNQFLKSVRVLELKKEFVNSENGVYWAICVTFMPNSQNSSASNTIANTKGKVDYKDLLSEEEFARFCHLRKIRKNLADADALPAFAIFTDAELAEISKLKSVSISELKKINGIGAKKIEKYGESLCKDFAESVKLIENEA